MAYDAQNHDQVNDSEKNESPAREDVDSGPAATRLLAVSIAAAIILFILKLSDVLLRLT